MNDVSYEDEASGDPILTGLNEADRKMSFVLADEAGNNEETN